jgi:peptidyl-prolyl cis-trans isomerase D
VAKLRATCYAHGPSMLDLFRKRGLSSVIYGAVIVATILVFVIQFRPNSGQRTASLKEQCVATVRGWCVDPKDYRSSYRLLMPRDQEGTPSPARARSIGLSKITLDGLVERELLYGEAEQMGLKVTDDEITDQIYQGWVHVSVPAADPQIFGKLSVRGDKIYIGFKDQKTKQFDMKVYERSIRNIVGRSPQEFREEQSREILAGKMRELIEASVRVSDTEAQNLYIDEKSSATVSSIAVKQSWVKRWGVVVASADVDAWAKDATNAAEVDKIVKEREAADLPKANHIRHILVKTPPSPSDDDLKKAAVKLADARARIAAGASFAEVAREMSDDKGSSMQGGDVGEKTDGFVTTFKDAANALKAGETTKTAIESPFGLHLIMKDDPANEAAVKAALPKDIARELYLKSKSLERTKDLATKLLADVAGGKKPDDAINALVASLPKLPAPPAPMAISHMPKPAVDGGAPASTPLKNKADKTDKVDTLKAAFAGDDPDRPTVVVSSPFNKAGDPIAGISPDAQHEMITFAFSAKDGDWMKEPLRADDGFLLVGLKEHKTATPEEFEKEKSTFEQTLLAAKRAEAMSLHVKRLREQAKDQVKIDESYIADLKGDAGAGGGPGQDEDEEGP